FRRVLFRSRPLPRDVPFYERSAGNMPAKSATARTALAPGGRMGEMRRLLLAIAGAHALVARLAAGTLRAGIDLDGVERAILVLSAVERTAGHAAADPGIRLFLRHDGFLLAKVLLIHSAVIAFPAPRARIPAEICAKWQGRGTSAAMRTSLPQTCKRPL